jgi:hypothetical protein
LATKAQAPAVVPQKPRVSSLPVNFLALADEVIE